MEKIDDTAPGFDVEGSETAVSEKKPRVKLPKGFESEADFLQHMRKTYSDSVSRDYDNREAAREDIEFYAGEQWTDEVVQRRQSARKPVLTVNRLPAYVQQIVGNRRLNDTVIKVMPDTGGTKEIAETREGLIRSIQKNSDAEVAYNTACQHQVVCGIGNFQLVVREASDDVFDQDIVIESIDDPLAVVWDPQCTHPTGEDARFVFVEDSMTKEDFDAAYPWAVTAGDYAVTGGSMDYNSGGWYMDGEVKIVSYWRMRSRRKDLALMDDGAVLDITDKDLTELGDDGLPLMEHIVSDSSGAPIMRTAWCKYAELYICSGNDILEGPYELPIKRVPVFRVPGVEVRKGGRKARWGLVRFAKDPQRLHNFWRSTIAEKLMLSPRARWIAADSSITGREKEWRNAHLSDDPLLVYNAASGQAPREVQPAQIEVGLLQEATTTSQDIRDVTNIHEANLGQQSNEVSGKAIIARQRVGEVGTAVYIDNLNLAIEKCGEVINDLIPHIYSTPRIIKIIGADFNAQMVPINDQGADGNIDIAVGKYSITTTTGPSFVTRRVEAAESMLNMTNAMPQVAAVMADLLVKYQDWPGAEEIEKRLKKVVPQNLLEQDDLTPEQQQQAQQTQQIEQAKMQAQAAMFQAELRKANAEAAEAEAKAELARANVTKVLSGVETERFKVGQDAAYQRAMAGIHAAEVAYNDRQRRNQQSDE